jgi:hypothetical protein
MGASSSKLGWGMAQAMPGLTCPTPLGSAYRGKLSFRGVPNLSIPVPPTNYGRAPEFNAGHKISQYNLFKYGGFTPFTYASNFQNEAAALALRALKVTPLVDKPEMQRFCKWVKTVGLSVLMPTFKKHWPASFSSYIRHSNASPAVKAAVQRARSKLDLEGITEQSVLSRTQLYKWTQRKAFIKMENNLYCTPLGINWKPPRLIQGAQPEFVALVGPTFMTIQAEIKRCMSINDQFVFTSGISSIDAASHVNIPGWNIFENDVSSWDASMDVELSKLECWIAEELGAGRAVVDLMKSNVKTHGFTTHGCKYSIPGTRKSGDPFTSCFNSLINALMHLYCFVKGQAERKGKCMNDRAAIHWLTFECLCLVRMLVQGDDDLAVYHPSLRPRFDLLLKLGFKADNIHRNSIMEAEFCSCHIFRLKDGRLSFGPKMGRLLMKFLSFIEPPLHESPLSMARGVAIGHYPSASFIPGLKAVLDRVLVLTANVKAVKPKNDEYKMKFESAEGLEIDNTYFMDQRYGNFPMRETFRKFWQTAEFGSDLSLCNYHRVMFNKDSIGPTELTRLEASVVPAFG